MGRKASDFFSAKVLLPHYQNTCSILTARPDVHFSSGLNGRLRAGVKAIPSRSLGLYLFVQAMQPQFLAIGA